MLSVNRHLRGSDAAAVALSLLLSAAWSGGAAGAPAVPQVISGPAGAAPRGWRAFASAAGDLNRDGRPDLAVALAQADPPKEHYQDDRPRILALYLRGRDGRLHRSAVSADALLHRSDGGVFGDPFDSLTIERGAVVVRHYGGSADRWGFTHRFRYQEGDWKLIGTTRISHRTLSFESREIDHNLVTGLVLVAEHGPSEQAPTTRRAYHELRAGPVAAPPALDGRLGRGEWPGLAVALGSGDDVVAGRDRWRGQADLSARLGAVARTGILYLRAEVTDDRALAGDSVRLVDDRGRVIAPRTERRRAAGRGYVWEASYAIEGLPRATDVGEAEPLLRVSVEVTDADATGKSPTVLSTSRGGRRYPGAIRLAPSTGLPTLSGVRLP